MPLPLSDITLGDMEDDEESIVAPPFSPMSTFSDDDGSSDSDTTESPDHDTEDSEPEQDEDTREESCSMPDDSEQGVISVQWRDTWNGFKIVGDNIDKTVRASFQRIDHSTRSFHYFHMYATLDRVEFSGLSDKTPSVTVVEPLSLLPSEQDMVLVKKDMSIIISRLGEFSFIIHYNPSNSLSNRVIVQHMKEYEKQAKDVNWHISGRFRKEMAEASKVVLVFNLLQHDYTQLLCRYH